MEEEILSVLRHLAIFIRIVTKALQLEVVSNMIKVFLEALKFC